MAGSSSLDSQAFHLPLGQADYGETLELQRVLHARRRAGLIPDVVISVEHNPVITLGRSGSREHLLVSSQELQREGIELFEVERGGDVTYHGPGQLVIYPIVDLRAHGRDVKRFIERLEQATIAALSGFGIEAGRRDGYPGVWILDRKIASIGVYVRGWVSRHGLAINVDVNPAHIAMINPCGLSVEMVSACDLSDRPMAIDQVRRLFLDRLAEQFGWTLEEMDPALLLGDDDD